MHERHISFSAAPQTQHVDQWRPQGRSGTMRLLAWILISFLLATLCYFSLGHYDHNDHMYAVAPVIAQNLRAYADFAFVQTPLSLLIFKEIYRLIGAPHFYLSLRIFSLALQLAIVALGIVSCHRHARNRLFASLLFVNLYVWFKPAAIIGAEIGNYTLALALMALALVVLDVYRGRSWMPLVVGVLAGLALSAKLSYVYVTVAFGLMILLWANAPRSPVVRVAAYAVGASLGAAPILYYLFSSFDLFLFENVHFHYLSNIYRGLAPFPGISNLGLFSAGSAIVPLAKLLGGCALVWLLAQFAGWLWPATRRLVMRLTIFEKEILCLAGATAIGVVTPVIVFMQYLAAPAFCVFLFIALYLDRLLASDRFAARWRTRIGAAVIGLTTVLALVRAYALTTETIKRQHDGVYGITAVAHMREVIARLVAEIDRAHPDCHGDLVTAFGVPAIGAGTTFAPIDATGPFAMRLDDIFAQKAPGYRWMTDPSRYLTRRSLILSGYYADTLSEPRSPFEKVMDDYAVKEGFQSIALGTFIYRPVFLLVPPGCRIPEPALPMRN